MLAYTTKSVIKCLRDFGEAREFDVLFRERKENNFYNFNVNKGKITLTITDEEKNLSASYVVKDIEMLKLPHILIPVQLVERTYVSDGREYEKNTINVKYEAQLFVKVFRVMRDRVMVTISHEGNFMDCYHIDGKLLYIVEDDSEYQVHITDLYKFYKTHENYYILNISGLLNRYDYSAFMEKHSSIARELGKTFVKYRDCHQI